MNVKIYFRKFQKEKLNFEMTGKDARKLTLLSLLNDYACVAQIQQPEGTTPDEIFRMYQDRPIKLPFGVEHTSMSVGDYVLIDEEIYICCRCGWYRIQLKNIPSWNILTE